MTNKYLAELKKNLTLPVIVAPMFLVSSRKLVIEACKEGIIGTFPLLNARTSEILERWMEEITEQLKKIKIEEPNRKIAPWGVNLIIHKSNKRYKADLNLIKKYQPPLVITSLGKPSEIVDIVHEYGGLVFSDVISVEHAKKAASIGVDGLILVCNGAGGHGGTLHPFAFLAEVKEFWSGITSLSGCISHGQEIAATEILGADFAYMGTRFIPTTESLASEEYKQMTIESKAEDIIYTDAFSGVNANFLVKSLEKAGLDPNNLTTAKEIDVTHSNSKAWKDIWGAGQGVGSIKKVQPIAEVIANLKAEYENVKKAHC